MLYQKTGSIKILNYRQGAILKLNKNKACNNTLEFIPFGDIVSVTCIQAVSFKSLFKSFDTLSKGIKEKKS